MRSSGFTAAYMLIPGPTKNPIEKEAAIKYMIYVFSELFGFLTCHDRKANKIIKPIIMRNPCIMKVEFKYMPPAHTPEAESKDV